jgi:prolyl-tRNA editing enzyme YbaK/EbsC (Cys-tRNA(Pro) deacylase)
MVHARAASILYRFGRLTFASTPNQTFYQVQSTMNEIQNHQKAALLDQEATRLDRLKEILNTANVHYTILTHDLTVRSAQEGVEQGLGKLANMAPTFILQSDIGYLAAVIRGDTFLSYKKIRRELKLKNLCLAPPEQVKQVTGSEVGYVSLLNAGVATIIDSRLTEVDIIFGGCGVPHHTLKINPRDLIVLAQAHVFDFAEPKAKA